MKPRTRAWRCPRRRPGSRACDAPNELSQFLIATSQVWIERRFDDLQAYCLFVGPRRSGTTLLGQLLNAHPSVVIAHQLYSLEYVDGWTLGDWWERTHPTFRELARVFAKIAGAVAYMHGRGVLHRDLKLSNVMIRRNGEPVIIDLGCATYASAATCAAGAAAGAPPALWARATPWNAVLASRCPATSARRADIYRPYRPNTGGAGRPPADEAAAAASDEGDRGGRGLGHRSTPVGGTWDALYWRIDSP